MGQDVIDPRLAKKILDLMTPEEVAEIERLTNLSLATIVEKSKEAGHFIPQAPSSLGGGGGTSGPGGWNASKLLSKNRRRGSASRAYPKFDSSDK